MKEFVSYGRKSFVPGEKLKINATKTREHKVWVGEALVPLVYLDNGEILIPADGYEEAAKILERSLVDRH